MSASASFASVRTCVPAVAVLALACALDADAEPPLAGSRPATLVPNAAGTAGLPGSLFEEYRRRYDEALAQGQFVEAETAAKQAIDYLIGAGRRSDRVMADGLTRLAFAQRQRKLYPPALSNYRAAITLLEARENRLSPSLVAPLAALGDTYMESGHADLALPVYEHALHVRHVNDGPYTLEQVDLLDAIAKALVASGEAPAALDVVDRMFYLYARAFSPDNEEVLPALHRKARLLKELGRHEEERMVYRAIIRIVEDRRGERDLRLFDTYLALGQTYFHDLDDFHFRSEPTTETGETFLKRALRIAESDAKATWQMEARALLQLADYYTLRDVQDKARIHYRRTWALLSANAARLPERRRELEQVVALVRPNLDPFANFGYRSSHDDADPADYKDGYVVARFTINDRGRVRDVRIADAEPRGFASMETRVLQAMQGSVYRPRYDDGQPVSTSGRLFRHDYRYLESELLADREATH